MAVTIGAFDGVHRGHRFLLNQLRQHAERLRTGTLAITFEPDPADVISPNPPLHLTSLDEKVRLIEQTGLDELCVVHFDREVAIITAQAFMDQILSNAKVVELLVGYDFAMGHDRQGTKSVLAGYAARHNFAFFSSEAFLLGGKPVSASRIRKQLADGNVEAAAELLGRHPSVTGPVVEGDKRGRLLGFPTANISTDPRRAIPADGVYVAYTHLAGRLLGSVVNIGLRPTFNLQSRTIESHILDFDEDIYGCEATVEFLHRLRSEQKFSGIEAIREQIGRDAQAARELLNQRS